MSALQCPPANSSDVCTFVCSNNDVLGIGIRINFYFTMLLLAVIPQTPNTEGLLNTLYATAGLSGLGLLLTAIIQTFQKQLSLFHALFVLHILFFLGTGVSPMGKYHWTRGRVIMGVLLQALSVIAFTAWGLYLWGRVTRYGSQPICNDQIKYVVFFATVKATEPWLRKLWMATLVLSAVGLMVTFALKAWSLFVGKLVEDEERAEEAILIAQRLTPTAEAEATEGTEKGKEKPEQTWYIYMPVLRLLLAIYATVMLELTVRRNAGKWPDPTQDPTGGSNNTGPGVVQIDNSWQFGQVLSFVMIFANVNEAIHFLFGYLGRRKVKLARKHEAQIEEGARQAEGNLPPSSRPLRETSSNVSTLNKSAVNVSSTSGYELRNFSKGNAEVSETVVDSNLQSQYQPIEMLQ